MAETADPGVEGDERIVVLEMVAAGRLSPRQALELLAALEPPAPPAAVAAAGPEQVSVERSVRVHCEDGPQEVEFTLPLDALREIGSMLPASMAQHLPAQWLQKLPQLAATARKRPLLRIEDGSFALEIDAAED
jgi:hypothetical protein